MDGRPTSPTIPVRLVMHLDMDAFFAAIEQRDHPEYQGLPVIVGAQPGSRGVVSTCSYEARVYGVRSAMPISEAYRLCPHAVYLHPDMTRYLDVSTRIMQVLETISPVVEPVSVDEAFVDITGLERLIGSPADIGRRAKDRIRSELRLTASVGIGPNRLIAKLASDYQKPDGLTIVLPDEVQAFLDPLPVGKLAGVGKALQRKCEACRIRTIGDLRRLGLKELQRLFGPQAGLSLHDRSRGIASAQVGGQGPRKSISREVTFEKDVRDPKVLHDTLLHLASDVGSMARRQRVAGRVVTLKIRLASFETHTRRHRLARTVDTDVRIFQAGWELWEKSGFLNRAIRLIGVGLAELEQAGARAGSLFTAEREEKEKRLFAAVDRIKARHGKEAIHLAGDSGADKSSKPSRRRPAK